LHEKHTSFSPVQSLDEGNADSGAENLRDDVADGFDDADLTEEQQRERDSGVEMTTCVDKYTF
jgi:hypothetical protein